MYSEKVMEHFSSPHNMGELKDANAIGEVGNAKCGDIMRMYLKIEDDIIKDASFKTFGCCAAIASSSVATDLVKGKSVEEALSIKNSDVVEELDGLPPVKVHCSVLAEEAIRKAIENYKNEQIDKGEN
jgi:nitrogen fixation NifU-like protein